MAEDLDLDCFGVDEVVTLSFQPNLGSSLERPVRLLSAPRESALIEGLLPRGAWRCVPVDGSCSASVA